MIHLWRKILHYPILLATRKIAFDKEQTDTLLEGEIAWSAEDGTIDLGLNGGDTNLKVGLEQLYYVRNATVSQINKGTVVRFDGSLGASGRLKIAPFLADNTYDSHYVMGVAAEDIPAGTDGYVTSFGKVRGVNTSGYTAGDVLYASPTSAGQLTTTRPSPPNNIVVVAAAVDSKNNGNIFVRTSFEDIFNTTPTAANSDGIKGEIAFDNNYIYICTATNTWKRAAISTWP
jgi:hypothetical protein